LQPFKDFLLLSIGLHREFEPLRLRAQKEYLNAGIDCLWMLLRGIHLFFLEFQGIGCTQEREGS
jgi:hypothetical protein